MGYAWLAVNLFLDITLLFPRFFCKVNWADGSYHGRYDMKSNILCVVCLCAMHLEVIGETAIHLSSETSCLPDSARLADLLGPGTLSPLCWGSRHMSPPSAFTRCSGGLHACTVSILSNELSPLGLKTNTVGMLLWVGFVWRTRFTWSPVIHPPILLWRTPAPFRPKVLQITWSTFRIVTQAFFLCELTLCLPRGSCDLFSNMKAVSDIVGSTSRNFLTGHFLPIFCKTQEGTASVN